MVFYHNITKQIFNMSEVETVVLNSEETDVIMYTRSGNALLFPLGNEYAKSFEEERQRLKEQETKEDSYHQND